MALGPSSARADGEFLPAHELFRSVRCLEGEVEIEALYAPRPAYAKRDPHIAARGRLGWQCSGDGTHLHLVTDLAFTLTGHCTLGARERLRAGDRRQASLTSSENDIAVILPIGEDLEHRIEATIAWWHEWSRGLRYDGPYREAVARSALTLKLLTYCLSGAIVAAGTTSIPVGNSGQRNWDYRYCWLRDTSLTLRAFMGLGQYDESDAFFAWLLHATRLTRPRLQVVYDVFGESRLHERELKQFAGLHGLGPVRIGNGASSQTQLDLYGELMTTAREFVERGGRLDGAGRRLLAGWAREAASSWRLPDQGIWEIRLPPRHNTHSKLMCWAALDGALWLDERVGLPIDRVALEHERDTLRADIDNHAWDPELGGYVGWYGGKQADASVLLMLRTGFLAPDDPRMRGTVDLIERQLCVDDGLVYRYPPDPRSDGVPSTEGLFLLCSFWRVEALVLEGRIDEAQVLFERLVALRNPVGLYAEELEPDTLALTGNFPQAFSHVGLISAALVLAGARPVAASGKGDSDAHPRD
jgi:GH15 family glucan-1,4-alpha-glucosidase